MKYLDRMILAKYAAQNCDTELVWELIHRELASGLDILSLDLSQLSVGTP